MHHFPGLHTTRLRGYTPAAMTTLRSFAAVWRSGSGGKVCSERWEIDRRQLLKRLLTQFGDLTFAELHHRHFWRIQQIGRAEGLSQASINRAAAAGLAFVRDAEAEGFAPEGIHDAILKRVELPKERVNNRFLPWTQAQRDRILAGAAHLHPAWRRYIAFLFFTGSRTSEALGLRRRNLHLEERMVAIVESRSEGCTGHCKTERSVREMRMPHELVAILSTLPAMDPETRVFCGPRGHPLNERNFRRKVWDPLLEECGVPPQPPRCARHTYCSLAIANGISFADLAELAGDKVSTLEGRYARYTQDRMEIDVDRAIGRNARGPRELNLAALDGCAAGSRTRPAGA